MKSVLCVSYVKGGKDFPTEVTFARVARSEAPPLRYCPMGTISPYVANHRRSRDRTMLLEESCREEKLGGLES